MNNWKITDVASYAPQRVVTNDDLSQLMDTSDEWIKERTGISQRHISSGENTSDLATKVGEKLLAQSGWSANDVDLIIVATMSPDSYTPSTAAIVQGRLGADHAVAFDLSAACSGFVYALTVAGSMLQSPQFNKAMVIGSEVLSKIVDWKDRSTAVLFGDGAGGVLLTATDDQYYLGQDLTTFGKMNDKIVAGQTTVSSDFPHEITGLTPFKMDGRSVYKFSTHEVTESIKRAVEDAQIDLDQVDHFVLHQANARIITQVAKRLNQPLEKFPVNIDQYGNTSAASEPILLADCIEKGVIKRGDTLALAGFGGGLTVGTIIIKY
ncbi:MAG: beta-ketoacyl-ACP synthase III [Limosilactobacillus sp.]|uniref:beta-ketoacyl-ACP synthase III n=1 Tax=Limosilactobacillus sp. TaxID=2773925 RepID=UPI00270490E4|nr:beta-ketoacyl-ACP synthase III [Limosilactobacillus sp.]